MSSKRTRRYAEKIWWGHGSIGFHLYDDCVDGCLYLDLFLWKRAWTFKFWRVGKTLEEVLADYRRRNVRR